MCGIAGILNYNGETPDRGVLMSMCDTLFHRGPDGFGYFTPENSPVALGHRRLSIIDLTENGAQPMQSACGRYWITYNGEVYNYKELKALLPEDVTLRSDSDTEIIIELFAKMKEGMLPHLDGMFALAIWDNQDKKLFCARDRFGEKPFFYSNTSDSFMFASELKALRSVGRLGQMERSRAFDFLIYGIQEDYRFPSETFFKETQQLQSAHYMYVGPNGPEDQIRYWKLERTTSLNISFDEAVSEFNRLFRQSIQRRLRSDVPVGSSLSGGLDSSSILAILKDSGYDLSTYKTFSARFEGYSLDEGTYIDIMNSACGVKGHSVYLNANDFENNLEQILYHQDEPVGGSSIIAQYMVMQASKNEGIKVLLDGQGADEFLAGYLLYMDTYSFEVASMSPSERSKQELGLSQMHGVKKPPMLSIESLKRSFPNLYERSITARNSLRSLNDPYFRGLHPEILKENKVRTNPLRTFTKIHDHLYFSMQQRGLNELLRYADRNSMAHSVEVRLPFLSHELVEYVFNLPSSYLINEGWSKYLLRKSMNEILPAEICWRKEKIGYSTPETEWMASEFFKNKKSEAVQFLKKEKIISTENPDLSWRYLSLANSMRKD